MGRGPAILLFGALALLGILGGIWFSLARRAPEAAQPARNPIPVQADPQPAPSAEEPRATAAPAPAPGPAPLPNLVGRTETVSCRQGQCAWHRILRFERVRTLPQGELRRLVLRSGTSPDDARPRDVEWQEGERTDYVFCSTVRPAYAFPPDRDGRLIVHYLDLFALAGYQQASAMVYMRACHGRDFDEGSDMRALGYRPGTRNEQVEGGSPEDLTRF